MHCGNSEESTRIQNPFLSGLEILVGLGLRRFQLASPYHKILNLKSERPCISFALVRWLDHLIRPLRLFFGLIFWKNMTNFDMQYISTRACYGHSSFLIRFVEHSKSFITALYALMYKDSGEFYPSRRPNQLVAWYPDDKKNQNDKWCMIYQAHSGFFQSKCR